MTVAKEWIWDEEKETYGCRIWLQFQILGTLVICFLVIDVSWVAKNRDIYDNICQHYLMYFFLHANQ